MNKEFNNLSDEAKELIKKYCQVLRIKENDAKKMIFKNESAYSFLKGKSGLLISDEKENLGTLIKLTLFRLSIDDFSPINSEEIKMVKSYYGVNI